MVKLAALTAASAALGAYWGWGTIGEIDPVYYRQAGNGIAAATLGGEAAARDRASRSVLSYGIDYPYAPTPEPAPGIEPPPSLPPDPGTGLSEQPPAAPAVTVVGHLPACTACGGPLEAVAAEAPGQATPARATDMGAGMSDAEAPAGLSDGHVQG